MIEQNKTTELVFPSSSAASASSVAVGDLGKRTLKVTATTATSSSDRHQIIREALAAARALETEFSGDYSYEITDGQGNTASISLEW